MPHDKPKPPQDGPKRRKLPAWKKALFATVVVLAFFLITELVLSMIGLKTLIEREDPFRGFSGLVTVFERDGKVYRTRQATIGNTFNDQSFLAEKPAVGLRIFCLGGSSSYGFPWGAEAAFTSIVGEVLTASHPNLHVEAVNASGVSYAMHRLNIVADELLEHEPDVFMIYSGHNEFIEPTFFEALKHRSVVRTQVEYVLAHSRTYSGMWSVFHRRGEAKPFAMHDLDATVRRDDQIFTPQEKEKIVAEYRWRLERLVRRAQAAGVKVVLVTVPCNQRQWSPKASGSLAALNDEDRRAWSEAFGSGKRQLRGENFEAARPDLERAARLAPGHAETQYLLGKVYDVTGRWEDARRAYQRACDADASPVRRISGINKAIRAVAREREVLLVDADRIFEQHSEHGLVGFNLIEDYVHPTRDGHELIAWHIWDAMEREGMLGDKTPADREAFDRVIAERRRPTTKNATWFFNQGVVLQNQGETEAAIEKFRQALEISPDYVGAMTNLGRLLLETGQSTEALRVLERSVEIEPEQFNARTNLGRALQSLERFDEAVAHYKVALRINPDYAEAHNNLGVALQRQGKIVEAIEHYHRALRINPDYAKAHNNLGVALQGQGKIVEAIDHYDRALRIKPDNAKAHTNLGNVLLRQGKIVDAIEHYHRALRIKPDDAEAHNKLGIALQRQGKFVDAIEQYHRALRINPDYAEVYNNLGVALQGQGKIVEAIENYHRALQINPDDAEAHNNLGVALQRQGKIVDAIEHHHWALRINPDYAEAHNNLGVALQGQGKIVEAIDHYDRALRIKPDNAAAHTNLGNALRVQRDIPGAVRHYSRALNLNPDFLMALNHLAWIRATHPDVALRDGNKAIELAERSCELTGNQVAAALDTLAAAYAEAGRFRAAVKTATDAIDAATDAGDEKLARIIRGRRELYRQSVPYREPSE